MARPGRFLPASTFTWLPWSTPTRAANWRTVILAQAALKRPTISSSCRRRFSVSCSISLAARQILPRVSGVAVAFCNRAATSGRDTCRLRHPPPPKRLNRPQRYPSRPLDRRKSRALLDLSILVLAQVDLLFPAVGLLVDVLDCLGHHVQLITITRPRGTYSLRMAGADTTAALCDTLGRNERGPR